MTPHGLHKFQVMPFGLINASSVFQRLMEKVLVGLNPEDGPDFVAVYIDNDIVFSCTLEEYAPAASPTGHSARLKLIPGKCHFIREEVEYLGHIITPQGLKTNPSCC